MTFNLDDSYKDKTTKEVKREFIWLFKIIRHLRSEHGCAWDKLQTPYSIRKNLLEEAYELIAAIEEENTENIKEELGDLFLILIMMSWMNEQAGHFQLKHVLTGIAEKLIRRHPHVFKEQENKSVKKILAHWDYIKENIEGKKPKQNLLETIHKTLPPLEKAFQIQKKVSKVGFDWANIEPVWDKLEEEIQELKAAYAEGNLKKTELELGDVLFSIVNLGRLMKINSSLALNRANRKFINRFNQLENKLKERNIKIKDASLKLMDSIWDELKEAGQ
jgi:tetrapyrrole methylase family protein/MazG family protein